MKKFISVLLMLIGVVAKGQEPILRNVVPEAKVRKSSFEILPTFGNAPETGVQLGFDLVYFKDFAKGDSTSRMSKLFFWGFYTAKQQYSGYGIWQIYTPHEDFNFNGTFQTGYWVDRFYRIGNVPDAQVLEYRGDGSKMLNYANYSYTFTNVYGNFDRKIAPHLFGGFVLDYDVAGNNQFLADSVKVYDGPIDLRKNDARRVGVGINLNYDTRDNSDNPKSGTYVQASAVNYKKIIGSDHNYHTFVVDADEYINTYKDHTLALRMVSEYRKAEGNDWIPIRGMSYNGGISVLRGYYAGTYRDNNLLAFETEYRMPIYIDPHSSVFEFWKRLGVVAFLSGVKVAPNYGDLLSRVDNFHLAGGFGLRYMLDMKQRINVAMDYAIGFDKVAGQGSRPSGLYFDLGEAF